MQKALLPQLAVELLASFLEAARGLRKNSQMKEAFLTISQLTPPLF